jgi:translation initiation factor IF-3
MDLVLVSPKDVVPPVCKILNYGQLRYEQNKKDKKAKRHAKATAVVKELKLSSAISSHDYQVRVNQCKRFLEKGYKVKVLVQFKGREITHADLGIAMLNKFGLELVGLGAVEAPPRLAGFMVHIVVAPNRHHR